MKIYLLDLKNAKTPAWWPTEMPDQLTLLLGRVEKFSLTVDESLIPRNAYQKLVAEMKRRRPRGYDELRFWYMDVTELPIGATITYLGNSAVLSKPS